MRGLLRRARPNWAQIGPFIAVGLLLAIIMGFFLWRIDSVTTGVSPAESASRNNSRDIKAVIKRGVNAPYYSLQYSVAKTGLDDKLALRISSVIVGLFILVPMLAFLRSWFGRLVAVVGGVLFITTPWIILAVRTGTPNVMLLWPAFIISVFVLMSRAKRGLGLWWLLFCFGVGLSLYVPGLIWFLLGGAAVSYKALGQLLKRVDSVFLVTGIVLFIMLTVPLAMAVSNEPAQLKYLMLIPTSTSPALEIISSIGWSAASLFWQTRDVVDIGLGRIAVLNFLQIASIALGIYALSARAKKVTYSLFGLVIFSIIAAGVNHSPHLLLIGLPALAVFMAAGLRYLFLEWRRIFPLNPFAYGLALTLIALVMLAHLLYAGRYTLYAWPNSSETKSVYVLK